MKYYDKDMNPIDTPDETKGTIECKSIEVTHSWVVDTPAEYEEVVIAEYDNGGRDVEYQVKTSEVGHWETKDTDGNIIENFDDPIPDDLPHDVPNPDTWTYGIYTPFTEEEQLRYNNTNRIAILKMQLAETDYVVTKVSEMTLSGGTLPDEDVDRYSEIIANRQEWRDEINQLESEIAGDNLGETGQN